MNNESIYKDFILAKNGTVIPVLNSGRTIESRYNPDKEAETQIQNLEKKYNAFLILGIGSGILIKKIKLLFPDALIIAVEKSKSEIDFLFSNNEIQEINKFENIFFVTIENLEQIICEKYLPAKYGDLKVFEQRNWIFENQTLVEALQNKINCALKQISADFSVQSHFGKIWCNNILHNLKLLSGRKFDSKKINSLETSKTAYVIGAGPSIDQTIKSLIKDSNKIVISTDTGFQILQKYNIKPDIVVSLDGQNISYNHFVNSKSYTDTLYFFDLAGDFSASKNVPYENLFFFVSGHPFSNYINNYLHNSLPSLYSGAGTVTISALDLAVKLGFKNIKVLGADFSYLDGKSYAKGSYLDILYNYKTSKISSNEFLYDKLIFRTPLTKIHDKVFTTSVLNSYKESFEEYLNYNNLVYKYRNYIYEIKNSREEKELFRFEDFDYEKIMTFLKKSSPEDLEVPLLPLIAYYRKINNYDEKLNYLDFLKLAHSFIVSYN